MTDGELVSCIWHFSVEDSLSWKFCAGIASQCAGVDITPTDTKIAFNRYFKNKVGITPDVNCPLCGKKLVPRKSVHGYFIGCTAFPECKFMATDSHPYSKK